MPISLGELATQFACELIGDPDAVVHDVASIQNASPTSLSFLSNPGFRKELPATRAAAVILRASDVDACPVNALVSENPYAMYARMASAVCPEPSMPPAVHTSAVVADSASVAQSAHVAANAVIGERSSVGDNVYVGAGVVIGSDCVIGDASRLLANATLVRNVTLGARCIVHSGAVIGSDGFGNAMTPQGWVKVPQLGGVVIGCDVEIGANSTVDCGAIGDTVIEDGVRLDNHVMIAHNVRIGAHTAMAAQSGIAGSATIGKRCLLAGNTGIVGHITVCDDVVVTVKSIITKDVTKPGTYGATFPADDAKLWAKQVARFRRLGSLFERVKKLEK